MKVAIIIPTMNRPDFILRQFEFYELMNSPHPIYISDSSNDGNAEKLKNGIKKFKKLKITYQWAPPGKDPLHSLLPLVKEKYCIQIGDDDLIIPNTISECADFLESHPDYATCAGKQVNIRFRKEDYIKPYGIIAHQTLPHGRSVENEDMLVRAKSFWSDPFFICFVVTRLEVEKDIRNITQNFSIIGRMTEFLLVTVLITAGKAKVLDKLGYVMQISDNRYDFDHNLVIDLMTSPPINEHWSICEKGLSEIICKKGISEEKSLKIAKWLFVLYLARQFALEVSWLPVGQNESVSDHSVSSGQSFVKKLRHLISQLPFLKSIFYKYNPPSDVTMPESKYYKDFKTVKDFFEKSPSRA